MVRLYSILLKMNRFLPSRVFCTGSTKLLALDQLRTDKIPHLKHYQWRVATADDLSELCELVPSAEMFERFFRKGSIGIVVEENKKILAMLWVRLGPTMCDTDDEYRHGGFKWELEEDEAWIHNGRVRADLNGSGVYIVAFRGLLEFLSNLGIKRIFSKIDSSNVTSSQIHNKLGMKVLGTLSWVRVLSCARFVVTSNADTTKSFWTLKKSFLLNRRLF